MEAITWAVSEMRSVCSKKACRTISKVRALVYLLYKAHKDTLYRELLLSGRALFSLYIENFSESVPGTRGRLALRNFLAAAEGRRDWEGRREKEGEREMCGCGGE
jgi:hypothetical protein